MKVLLIHICIVILTMLLLSYSWYIGLGIVLNIKQILLIGLGQLVYSLIHTGLVNYYIKLKGYSK